MLKPGSLYLINSGAQYLDGTTDVTRTLAIGTPTPEMKRHYGLVLKAHIAIATARFPKARAARISTRSRAGRYGRRGSISITAPGMASAAFSRCMRGRSACRGSAPPNSRRA